MGYLTFFILAIIVGVMIGIISEVGKSKKIKNYKTINQVSMGKYIIGHPDALSPIDNITCAITEDALIFIGGFLNEEMKILLNSINNIFVEDKSRINQRLTATRILALGIFSLAAPKKKKYKEYCLVIDWNDKNNIRQNTVFEFTGNNSENSVNIAQNTLKKFIKK